MGYPSIEMASFENWEKCDPEKWNVIHVGAPCRNSEMVSYKNGYRTSATYVADLQVHGTKCRSIEMASYWFLFAATTIHHKHLHGFSHFR